MVTLVLNCEASASELLGSPAAIGRRKRHRCQEHCGSCELEAQDMPHLLSRARQGQCVAKLAAEQQLLQQAKEAGEEAHSGSQALDSTVKLQHTVPQ
jgi:hypothetical protein